MSKVRLKQRLNSKSYAYYIQCNEFLLCIIFHKKKKVFSVIEHVIFITICKIHYKTRIQRTWQPCHTSPTKNKRDQGGSSSSANVNDSHRFRKGYIATKACQIYMLGGVWSSAKLVCTWFRSVEPRRRHYATLYKGVSERERARAALELWPFDFTRKSSSEHCGERWHDTCSQLKKRAEWETEGEWVSE